MDRRPPRPKQNQPRPSPRGPSAASSRPSHDRPAPPSGPSSPSSRPHPSNSPRGQYQPHPEHPSRPPHPDRPPPPPKSAPARVDIDFAELLPLDLPAVPMPPEVAALLAEQHIELEPGDSEKLGRYLAMLLLANQSINLTAVTDPAEGWRRHLADALMLIPLVASFEPTEFIDAEADPDAAMAALRRTGDPAAPPTPAAIPAMRVVDVGTGGGLPGIPLAIALPDVRFTLIEATGKKVQFLRLVRKRLGLMNVDVVQARAEAAGQDRKNHRETYDIAIARAVGSLAVLVELAGPLVKPGGVMLAVKGEKAQQEVTEAEEAIAKIGLSFDQIVPTATSRVVVLPKVARTPKTYPRRDGEPSRVPIGITREREAPEPRRSASPSQRSDNRTDQRPTPRSRPPRGGGPRRS